MKKLLLALLVVSSLVTSCGKKNSVGNNLTQYGTNPLTVTGTVESQLGNMIDQGQFGNGIVIVSGYQETWNQYISQMPGISYKFGRRSCANWYCYNLFGNTNVTETITRTVVNSSVDIVAKKNELKGLLNQRLWVRQVSNTGYEVKLNNGSSYMIDTQLPLQANPVSSTDAAGSKEDFLGASL